MFSSVCATFCSLKGERGSDRLWPGTGHYNKQRMTMYAGLKGRQEVLIATWVGFILIHVTHDVGILEHTEGRSRTEMDNQDISIQPARDAVSCPSVFQGSSVIKLWTTEKQKGSFSHVCSCDFRFEPFCAQFGTKRRTEQPLLNPVGQVKRKAMVFTF